MPNQIHPAYESIITCVNVQSRLNKSINLDHRLQLLRTAPTFTVGIIKNIYNVVFHTWVGSRFRLLLVTRQNSKTWGTNTLASLEGLQQPRALFPFRVPYRHVRVSVEILQQERSWLLVQLLSNFHSRLIFSLYMGLYISLPPPHFWGVQI